MLINKMSKEKLVAGAALPKSLAEKGSLISYKKGEFIARKDEEVEYAWLIISGTIDVLREYDSGEMFIYAHLRKGRYISDLEILSRKMVFSCTLVVSEAAEAMRFNASDFIKALDSCHEFLMEVVCLFAESFYEDSYRKGEGTYGSGEHKVVVYLARYFSYKDDGIKPIEVKTTHKGIASEIGTSEKTVNRAVKSLERKGLIDIVKGRITIRQSQKQLLEELI